MKVVQRSPDYGYLDSSLWVPKRLINVEATQSALSFLFTDSYTGKQRVLSLWKETTDHLLVPRAFWDIGSLPCRVIDCRPSSYSKIAFRSGIRLDHRPDINGRLQATGENVQHLSLRAMQQSMGGVLQLHCGCGKTIVALEKIATGRVPALVMVDNTHLLEQWLGDVEEFLKVPGGVGVMGAGRFEWNKGLVLATYQTIASKADEMPEEVRRWFGQIFWDEGHHVSAPVFSKTVDLFYGHRFALTATPKRDDGLHIISDFHIGRVIHQDLRQPIKARIIFKWTGLHLDLLNPQVAQAVLDVTGEVHMSKVPGYLGGWRPRLWLITQDCMDAVQAGRKTLVLSNSVDEVVNLAAIWTRGPHADLYSDIPEPTPADVGETLAPEPLDAPRMKQLKKDITCLWRLHDKGRSINEKAANRMMLRWSQALVARKIDNERVRRQRVFIKSLLEEMEKASTAGCGLMTFGVPAKVRQQLLDDRPVTFAITKYGKEGLDCPALDTVLVSSLFSSKNALQQLMGRPTRPRPGKKTPIVVFYVDDIGQSHGMSKKLMKHLRTWPHEEGGPFHFEMLGYPQVSTCKDPDLKSAMGR